MQKASQPIYKIKVEKNVLITMRDGVKVACDICHPDAEGRFPALLSMSPYGKDIQALKCRHHPRLGQEWGLIEAGNIEFFVSRGYVHVVNDVRGTGIQMEGSTSVSAKSRRTDTTS